MYPNVPTRREGSEVFPYSVNFVSPKSATCTKRVNFGIMKVTSVTPLKQKRKKEVISVSTTSKQALSLPFPGSSCLLVYLLI